MHNTLIIYSTVDGHTHRICEVIAEELRHNGEQVSLVELSKVSETQLTQCDKVLIGASIRYGKHRPALYQFINRHKALLDARINGFFTVNVVARKPEKNTPETNPYMQKFLQLSLWQPQQLGVFAGKIVYADYSWLDRTMIRFIMWMTKGPTDTSQAYEFTDWENVRRFAREFAAR
ncbi:menaquinone-dependent protoporphyrinogen IX dehydrogenase [Shewanella yunxiaonensis]|uniref:Protoporphyrinogen IX dehydrogenase [quinone] n=1 Tax=Shewanella yunxiaonensis TaxID=2829809 RepID=A0ABX7YTE9_9GAMM|nr:MULTISPECIES: menaquinone-dependent protoporphyrinogen IX dehydrogenase [Shewanella]MDF0535362.1 menaquinone-dependent protoporphyrinogen IX dehydrogenase [Shewanella sp. A32]QUN05935.1 menaquinone-dependent protoporphyrinogen IX dehydrogenase [Shewanella yunxiaonensis]